MPTTELINCILLIYSVYIFHRYLFIFIYLLSLYLNIYQPWYNFGCFLFLYFVPPRDGKPKFELKNYVELYNVFGLN